MEKLHIKKIKLNFEKLIEIKLLINDEIKLLNEKHPDFIIRDKAITHNVSNDTLYLLFPMVSKSSINKLNEYCNNVEPS